ncbi:MAG: hypothetical protein HXX20_08625 [Chloroflexi bacterium]|nr:hypothetical protein [Chloroflexota bacterium]
MDQSRFPPRNHHGEAQERLTLQLEEEQSGKQHKMARLWAILRNWLSENGEPLRLWLAFRLVLFVIPIFAGILIPFSEHNPLPPDYIPNPNIWMERLIRSWTRWDGGFYTTIASQGYTPIAHPGNAHIAFFPLYPHLIRAVAVVFAFGNTRYDALNISGIVISSLATLALFLGLYKLARLDYDHQTSRLSVIYLAAFPMSFFLLAIYTESLFMALAVWAFWAARKNRWLLACGLAALAVLSKNQGVLLVAALGIEYLYQIRFNPKRLDWRIFTFGLPALALAGWMGINALTFGDPLQYVKAAQDNFARFFAWPFNTLGFATEHFFNQRSPGTFLPPNYDPGYDLDSILYDYPITLAFLGVGVVALVAVWRKRVRLSYVAFFALCLAQPLFSPNRISILASLPRYLLLIFPAFLLLALLGRRWPLFHYLYLGLNLPLLGIFLARYALNYWVA